jgi:hypothetical protein
MQQKALGYQNIHYLKICGGNSIWIKPTASRPSIFETQKVEINERLITFYLL